MNRSRSSRSGIAAVWLAHFWHDGDMAPADWTQAVYDVVKRIAPGRVATYGMVGMLAGRPRAARAVGNAMRECVDETVPCHRVVRSSGEPAFARHRVRL